MNYVANTEAKEVQLPTTSSLGKVKGGSSSRTPIPKSQDFIINGFFNKKPIHVSAFILRNGKVSLGTDLCPKKEVVTREQITTWSTKKLFKLFARPSVEVLLCGNKVHLVVSDLTNLLARMDKIKKEQVK